MTHATADTECHIVQCRALDGTLYIRECDPSQSLEQIASDILSGEIERPVAVIYFNPFEGVCRDVTEDCARLIGDMSRDMVISRGALDLIEEVIGLDVADEVRAISWAA